jgi:hypothetical protein
MKREKNSPAVLQSSASDGSSGSLIWRASVSQSRAYSHPLTSKKK